MRKLFTLLTLLVICVTGAWADTTILDYTIPSTDPGTGEKNGTTGKINIGVSNKYSSVTISDVTYYGIKLDGENDSNGSKWVKAIPTNALQVGDVISIKGWSTSNTPNGEYGFDLYTTVGGTVAHSISITGSKNTLLDATYTVATGSPLIGASNFYICRKNTKSTIFNSITITRPPTVPNLTGSWSAASNSFYQGDDAPSIPTFMVGASDNSSPAASAYSVVYSLKEGSTAGIVTVDANSGISAISNSTVGTATVVATLTTANANNYQTPTTNTFEYTVTVNAKSPSLSLDKESVTLKSTPVARAASTTVNLTGAFLTGASGTATWTAVDGLTITPAAFTITDGAASQEFTVTYNKEAATSGSVEVTFSDGTTSKVLTVNYSSVVAHTQTDVSGDTTWDWETLKNTLATVSLSAETTPKHTDADINLADFNGEVYAMDAKFPSSFDAQALECSSTQYPAHKDGYFQGTQIKMHTTTPGKIVVKFSNTGSSSRPYRYLYVNGVQDDYKSNTSASAGVVTTGAIPVNAGDITIKGIIKEADRTDSETGDQDNYLRIFSITFTAMPPSVSGTITASGYNTYSSNYPLDLSTISGGTAYVATSVTDGKVVLTKCTGKVPAATGLFIAGTAGEAFTINTTSETTTAPAANLFVGAPNGKTVSKADEGEYNYVFGWEDVSNPGFYLIDNTPAQLGSFKAYLHTTEALSAPRQARMSFIFADDLTGIHHFKKSTESVDGAIYNLRGLRVTHPTKGIFIMKGKKVIIK